MMFTYSYFDYQEIMLVFSLIQNYNIKQHKAKQQQGPLLLTWFNFNPSMDK